MPDMNPAEPAAPGASDDPGGRALAGVDFTSAPRRGKPVVWDGRIVTVDIDRVVAEHNGHAARFAALS